MPDAQLFSLQIANDYFKDIIEFLTTSITPAEYSAKQKKPLVVKESNFTMIVGQLYKLGPDEIL